MKLYSILVAITLFYSSSAQQIITAHMPAWEDVYSGSGYSTSLPLYWQSSLWPGVTLPPGVDKSIGTTIRLAQNCHVDELNIDIVYPTTQQWTYRSYVQAAAKLGGMHIAPCLDLPGNADPKAVAAWLKGADLTGSSRSTINGLPVIYAYAGTNQTVEFWNTFKAVYGPCFLILDDLAIAQKIQYGKASLSAVDDYLKVARLFSFRPDAFQDVSVAIQKRIQAKGLMTVGTVFPGYNATGMPYKPQGIIQANGTATMTKYYNAARAFSPVILFDTTMIDREEMTGMIVPDTINGTLRPDTCRTWFALGNRWKSIPIQWGP